MARECARGPLGRLCGNATHPSPKSTEEFRQPHHASIIALLSVGDIALTSVSILLH
jgi:hypothetical protein